MTDSGKLKTRARLLLAYLLAPILIITTAITQGPRPALADAAGKGGDFVATNGVLLDTRTGVGGAAGTRAAGSETKVTVLGVGGIPANGVRALLVDVTAINPTANTFLTVYPDGSDRPTASTINASAGQVLSNSAIVVTVGANGKVVIYNHSGNTHVKLDVQGYFTSSTGTTGGGLVSLPHTKLIDTRSGLGTTTGTIAGNSSRTVTLTGSVVPAGASAAVIDVIVTGAAALGWLSVAPENDATAANAIDYPAGTTSMGMIVKLPANGKVVLANKGSGAVHAVVTVQAYFTATPTTGAGLRTVAASRLLDTRTVGGGLPVAANGTVDVAVGGAFGLPTRDIAAVALNLTAVSPASSGFLTVWPVDGTTSVASTTNFTTGQLARSSFAVSKLGTEGKIRVKNNSSGTLHILVDLQGWFADPIPIQPVTPFTRTSAVQQSPNGTTLGLLFYGYTDNLGRMRRGTASPETPNIIAWETPESSEAFTGRPTLSELSDKRIQAAVQSIDGSTWKSTRIDTTLPSWESARNIGGSMAGPPSALTMGNGTNVVFAVDIDGRLWTYRQEGAAPLWKSLGDADLTGTVSVVKDGEDARLVAVSTTGTVKTALYFADGALSSWTDLGGTAEGIPAALLSTAHRLRIVIRNAGGHISTKFQDLDGTWPTTWQQVGSLTAIGSPDTILDPPSGRTAIAVRRTDNTLYHIFETAPGSSSWGQWQPLNPDPDRAENAATDPTMTAVTGPDGTSYVIIFRNTDDLIQVYSRQLSPQRVGGSSDERFVRSSAPAPRP
ncbi:hypothetical protein [Micromonospora sp. HUAS LYJ1]|uniref:hypothetical protein n=1 Tax=Micromonospora sp. HUAS LYJ1 TaxID=3061626 RepID=UPI002673F92F|nr:hypothetical protein [Micromonospora sp. HUAS LYJ1]WKU04328.1 hypothetical protein Q2K16_26520 [Micromonospora sp. HUAS LYJ1]